MLDKDSREKDVDVPLNPVTIHAIERHLNDHTTPNCPTPRATPPPIG